MTIYINTEGAYLRKKDDLFELKVDEERKRFSPKRVERIVISVHALLTTDAIKLATENNIDIIITDEFGDPVGRFWHARFGSTAMIRRRQVEVFSCAEGTRIAGQWIADKLKRFNEHLGVLKNRHSSRSVMIEEQMRKIAEYGEMIIKIEEAPDECRNTVMAYEGNASRLYYLVLSKIIPPEWKFEGRSHRPARDRFNCALNYGYGILYSRVEKALIIAGLDPYIGILHTDNYNKLSLVYDIIEGYRYLALEPVFKLFTRKMMNKSYFDVNEDGWYLNKEGKPVVVQAVTEAFEKTVTRNKRKVKSIDLIQAVCHQLANRLIGRESC